MDTITIKTNDVFYQMTGADFQTMLSDVRDLPSREYKSFGKFWITDEIGLGVLREKYNLERIPLFRVAPFKEYMLDDYGHAIVLRINYEYLDPKDGQYKHLDHQMIPEGFSVTELQWTDEDAAEITKATVTARLDSPLAEGWLAGKYGDVNQVDRRHLMIILARRTTEKIGAEFVTRVLAEMREETLDELARVLNDKLEVEENME